MPVTVRKKVFGGTWWRFDRYEVKDGYIQPLMQRPEGKPFLKCPPLRRYEPWEAYHTPLGKTSKQQPYHSLLNLINSIDDGKLEPAARDVAIAEWCGQHGLLGVLLLTTTPFSATILRNYFKTVPVVLHAFGVKIKHRNMINVEKGRMVDLRDISFYVPNLGVWSTLKSLPESNMLAQTFFRGGWHTPNPPPNPPFSLEHPWGPSEPDTFFWESYAEPIETFLAAARLLREVVKQLQGARDSKNGRVGKQAEFSQTTKLAIESLLSTVRPTMRIEGKSQFGLGWDCGSLLSTFAMMAALDFTNSRPLVCQNSKCARFFVSKSTEARYCSRKCRDAVHIRAYRERIACKATGKMK